MIGDGIKQLTEKVKRMTRYMGIDCQVVFDVDSGDEAAPIQLALNAPDDGRLLIGKNGQSLKALEQVIRAIWAKENAGRPISVDVNDYKKSKTKALVEHIHSIAQKVRATGRSEALDPMTSYDRRVVHTELAVYTDLTTESIGVDPYRRVVIKPL